MINEELLNNKKGQYLYEKKYNLWPNSSNKTITTDISLEGNRPGGRTFLAVINGHTASGDYTFSKIYMLRLGYSGDYVTPTLIAESKGSSVSTGTFTFSVNENHYLTLTMTLNTGSINLRIIDFN